MAPSTPWWLIRESTSVLGIRILLTLYRLAGRAPFRIVLGPVLLFYWLAIPRLRRASLEWLETSGAVPAPARTADGLRHLMRFAETILDKFLVSAGRGDEIELVVEGDEPFRNDPPGRGCVILTSHAGCQELLARQASGHTEHPIVVLQHTRHAEAFNELLKRAGAEPSRVLFREVGSFSPALAMELSDLVESGAYVVVAGDRTPIGSKDSTVVVPFFGRPASFPTGGALIAGLLGVPLRQMTCTRTRPSTPGRTAYRVVFDSIDETPVLPRRARAETLEAWTRAYAANLQAHIRRSPYDWFNFYDFWSAG